MLHTQVRPTETSTYLTDQARLAATKAARTLAYWAGSLRATIGADPGDTVSPEQEDAAYVKAADGYRVVTDVLARYEAARGELMAAEAALAGLEGRSVRVTAIPAPRTLLDWTSGW